MIEIFYRFWRSFFHPAPQFYERALLSDSRTLSKAGSPQAAVLASLKDEKDDLVSETLKDLSKFREFEFVLGGGTARGFFDLRH